MLPGSLFENRLMPYQNKKGEIRKKVGLIGGGNILGGS
jgi:hypothetical protein